MGVAGAAGGDGPVVRVGIYGAGGHSRNAHAPSLRALPGVEIVAIADPNLELAAQLAELLPGSRSCASHWSGGMSN